MIRNDKSIPTQYSSDMLMLIAVCHQESLKCEILLVDIVAASNVQSVDDLVTIGEGN